MTPLWTVTVHSQDSVEGVDWTHTFDELQAELDETKGTRADRIEVDGRISQYPHEVDIHFVVRGYCYTRQDMIMKKLIQDEEDIRDWVEVEVHYYMMHKVLEKYYKNQEKEDNT